MSKKYLWYINRVLSDEVSPTSGVDIHLFNPKVYKCSLPNEDPSVKVRLLRILFCILSCGRFKIYYAEDHGTVVHTSYLMPKCWKFPFLKKGEYEIGPCQTVPGYRGRGIYPAVLKKIIASNENVTFHMMVAEENHASIRGMEKAGFALAGRLFATPLRRYKIIKTHN